MKLIPFVLFALVLIGCADSGSYNPYPGGGYPSAYGGYDPDPYYRDDYRYRNRDRYRNDRDDRYDDDDDDDRYRDGNDGRYKQPPPPRQQQRPAEQVIRPSCPSGTSFDGRSCNITDPKLRRPGGDGRINPCPKGMWISGDRCVGN